MSDESNPLPHPQALDADEPALLPFAPLLHVAWADGILDAAELTAIAQQAERTTLPPAAKRALLRWLNPDQPPGAADLARLREVVQQHAAALPDEALHSLAGAGEAIANAAAGGAPALGDVLAELERALGVTGAEALRSMLVRTQRPAAVTEGDGEAADVPAAPAAAAIGAVDLPALHAFLEGDRAVIRPRVFAILQSPGFERPVEIGRADYRELVLQWCRRLADEGIGALGLPREFGGEHDVVRAITAFETLAFHDLSLTVKFGVQFGLFGGSIYMLGTRSHHERYLPAVASLQLPGCYAMTETGHGSNVRDIETTAVYDAGSAEFVVHTPHAAARKDYIGNAAAHGRMATVFAQLEVAGQQHGVHAFLVPIRDEHGQPLPGVTLEDCGPKFGLNGVDNGRIAFRRVRIPRENLLDRFGMVTADGAYRSDIASAGRRFFTMLGTLVAGRISIAAASLSAGKSGLAIALRYAARRRQFGPEGGAEVPILRYLAVQRLLLPRLATTYALDFALQQLVADYAAGAADDARHVEAAAAGLKAYASRHAVETLGACRFVCAGQGYLSENRLDSLIRDTEIFTTFEGVNDVLLQLVVKGMLTEYREQFGELRLWTAARYVAGRARAALSSLNPVLPRRTDPEHLRDPDFHEAAFVYREDRLLASLARRLRDRIDGGQDSFNALNDCQDHALAAANAHVERLTYQRFRAALQRAGDQPGLAVLHRVAALFALHRLEADSAWFLTAGYFEGAKARAVRQQVNSLCRELEPAAGALSDAFGIPDTLLDAPIARR
jgi:acyl-CoA oxidase